MGSALLMDDLPWGSRLLSQGLFMAFYLPRLAELEFWNSLGWPVQGQELDSMTLAGPFHLRIFCEMLRFRKHHQECLGPPSASGGVQTRDLDALAWVWL